MTKYPTPQESIFHVTETCATYYSNCILRFQQNISGGSTSTRKPEDKKKARSRREQAAHIFVALYQTYVRVRDQVFGSTPLCFKYGPVVLEVKIEEPLYPLHRLYPSTAVLL